MTTKEIKGVVTALATPFDADGRIDIPLVNALVDRSVRAGVGAVVAGGGTGEVSALSEDERARLFDSVSERVDGAVPVVANVGALTAAGAIRLGRTAEAAGADALMVIAPFYEPLTVRETERYFREVADSIALPIMLYNNPGVTGVNLDADALGSLARRIDNVLYVKDSSKDWEQALRLIHYYGDDIGLIVGWDSFALSAFVEGARGIMAGVANVIPNELVDVYRRVCAGDFAGARERWQVLFPVIDAMLALPFAPAVKAALSISGLDIGAPRAPLDQLTTEQRAMLEAALAGVRR